MTAFALRHSGSKPSLKAPMRVLPSLSGYSSSGTWCRPPYKTFQRQRRADNMTSVDRDNSEGVSSPITLVRAEEKGQEYRACGSSMMTVVPPPGVLSTYIIPW